MMGVLTVFEIKRWRLTPAWPAEWTAKWIRRCGGARTGTDRAHHDNVPFLQAFQNLGAGAVRNADSDRDWFEHRLFYPRPRGFLLQQINRLVAWSARLRTARPLAAARPRAA